MRVRQIGAATALALAATACGGALVNTTSTGSSLVPLAGGRMTVVAGHADDNGLEIAGGTIRDRLLNQLNGKRDYEIISPLAALLSPTAVASPDGRFVAFNAWQPNALAPAQPMSPADPPIPDGTAIGVPSVYVLDRATHIDTEIARGAYSVAVRADETIAYVKGATDDVRQNVRCTGTIVTQAGAGASPQTLVSRQDRWAVYGWAGKRLIAYRLLPGDATEVLAIDGPDTANVIATDRFIVAISPDGNLVALAGGSPQEISLVRVADGSVIAHLQTEGLTPNNATAIHAIRYSGSWVRDRIVVGTDVGLLALSTTGSTLAVEAGFDVPGEFRSGILEPAISADGAAVSAWTDLTAAEGAGPSRHETISCDLTARTCLNGVSGEGHQWTQPIRNPSRG